MLVRQAFDGAPIADIPLDDVGGLKRKLEQAARCLTDRSGWLPAYQRIEILRHLARLMEREFDALAMLIAREGGKPLMRGPRRRARSTESRAPPASRSISPGARSRWA